MPKTTSKIRTELRELRIDDLRGSSDAAQLFEDHWDEVALNKRVMKLNPHWKRYYALEEQGALLVLGLFAKLTKPRLETMVGYSVSFITEHMHYADLRYAQNDVLFVAKPWRNGRLGVRLILATEVAARERGAQLMLWHAKDREDLTLKDLLPCMGYGVQDIIYSKEL